MLFGSKKSSLREQDYALKDTFFLFHFKVQSLLKSKKQLLEKIKCPFEVSLRFSKLFVFWNGLRHYCKDENLLHLITSLWISVSFNPFRRFLLSLPEVLLKFFGIQVYCFCLFFVRQFSSFSLSDQKMKPESVYPMKLKIM